MRNAKILTVDDQIDDLEIINHILNRDNYDIMSATNGLQALETLEKHSDIDVVILDRMMPIMDGMSFLHRIKQNKKFSNIPVIMQTAAGDDHEINEGIEAGVYWYITKPFPHNLLSSIVKSALRMRKKHQKASELTDFYIRRRKKMKMGMTKLSNCKFSLDYLQDAKNVAVALSCIFPEPRKMLGACIELLVNAVEHGNLGISFEEKSQLLLEGKWEEEIEYRENLPKNRSKHVDVDVNRTDDEIYVKITDQGEGFDWKKYLNLDHTRAHKVNGRGIYLASLEFDSLEFSSTGNEVICRKILA